MRDHLLGEQRQMFGQFLDEAPGELGGLVLQPNVDPIALGKGKEQQVVLAIHRLEVLRRPQRERPDRPRPRDGDVRQLDGVRGPRPAQAGDHLLERQAVVRPGRAPLLLHLLHQLGEGQLRREARGGDQRVDE